MVKIKQLSGGMVISYALVILNSLYGLFLTPYIISLLGEVEYGVYKTIGSLSASLIILDLGLGGTTSRYVASFKANGKSNEIPNFVAMMLIQSLVIISILGIICTVIFFQIGNVYQDTFSSVEISLSKKLFVLLSINMGFTVLENVFNGVILGYNELIFNNGIKMIKLLCRIVLIVVLLRLVNSSIVLVCINLFISLVFFLIDYLFIRHKLGLRIHYSSWNRFLFNDTFKYTFLIFVTSLINQVNGNLDNIIIGAVISASAVAVYSTSLLVYGMFENLSVTISSLMLPTVIDTLHENKGNEKIVNIIIQAGRVQFILIGAAFASFLILGRDFIRLWLGNHFIDSYYLTIILMAPSVFSLVVNTCISILKAKKLLAVRTAILFATTLLNAFITIYFTKRYGYFAAACGTAISLFIGVDILINIYYWKRLSLNMLFIYKKIFSGTIFAIILSSSFCIISHYFLRGTSWFAFAFNSAVFCLAYFVSLFLFGLNETEKQFVYGVARKVENRMKGINIT